MSSLVLRRLGKIIFLFLLYFQDNYQRSGRGGRGGPPRGSRGGQRGRGPPQQ